ncbi:MAG TPA: hypothetical protein VKZ79_04455 [Alphaproteobacteria bacterium]|nr:hypothetical protein [Alphaproteobacteria bacterium]
MSVTTMGELPTNLRFKLGAKWHALVACVCLYRNVSPETMTVRYLVLTKDRRFAYLEAVVGDRGVRPVTEMTRERALRFLVENGEGDVVEEFPDIFREEPMIAGSSSDEAAVAPKDRPAEPYLFPLH